MPKGKGGRSKFDPRLIEKGPQARGIRRHRSGDGRVLGHWDQHSRQLKRDKPEFWGP